MEDFRRRKRSMNENDPQTISRSKSMRLNLSLNLPHDETLQRQHDCCSIIEERKRKRPDDFLGAFKIPRNDNLLQRVQLYVQERSFGIVQQQQHRSAVGYNNIGKGNNKGKGKGKGKYMKRQRDEFDKAHSVTKFPQVNHSDPPVLASISEPWKLRDMRFFTSKRSSFFNFQQRSCNWYVPVYQITSKLCQ